MVEIVLSWVSLRHSCDLIELILIQYLCFNNRLTVFCDQLALLRLFNDCRLLYNRSIFYKLRVWTQYRQVLTLTFYCASLIKIDHALQHANRLVSAHRQRQSCRDHRHSVLNLVDARLLQRAHRLDAPWHNFGCLDLLCDDSLGTAVNLVGQQGKFKL